MDANSAAAFGGGINKLTQALTIGKLYGEQAQAKAALQQAMMQQHQASADKAMAETEQIRSGLAMQNDPIENAMHSLGLPVALAPAFRERINTGKWAGGYETPAYDGVGPTMPPPANDDTVAKLQRAMSITQRMLATSSKVHQGTDAALDEQKLRGIDAVIANPSLAPNYGKANAAAAGKPLFNDVGNTGYSLDNFTGSQEEVNPALAKLFSGKEKALAYERSARGDRISSGLDKPVVIENDDGEARVTAIPTKGDPRTIGISAPKGGAEATNAKTRNAVIAAIEKDMPYAKDAEIAAEVEKRLARRGIKNIQPENKLPPGYDAAKVLEDARQSIANGKEREAVIQRVRQMGIDPTGL